VVIIGAGAAGLAAACELAKAGVTPLVLEARPRAGGRIHTMRPMDSGEWQNRSVPHLHRVQPSATRETASPQAKGEGKLPPPPQPEAQRNAPIELGAEFIHGNPPELERFAREHHLAKRAVPDEHWRINGGKFDAVEDFWGKLGQVFEELPSRGRDKSYSDFLKAMRDGPKESRALATDFIEGFHAADPKRISALSIAKSEAVSEKINGTQQFRLVAGYGELVRIMEASASVRGARIVFGHVVSRIEWRPHRVLVSVKCGEDHYRLEAETLILTLPLGVLQSDAVQFEPALVQKEESIRDLAMGNVVKVNLQLRGGLWPEERDGFIHLATKDFPTWWKFRNVVTAWAGGPKADELAKRSSLEVIESAMESLAEMFGVDMESARKHLEAAQYHDWRKDPFARGAYSYVPVGATDAGRALARPVQNTLFFAGEATAQAGLQGTVHGAIESGIRAAHEVLKD
jgi:monoamine oxidase